MEIKSQVGYVVCQKAKTVNKAKMVCPAVSDRDERIGISGYVYLYSSKHSAQEDADKLTKAWNDGTQFIVFPAEIRCVQ